MIDHKEHQVRRMHGSGASYRETPTSTDENTNSAIKSALLAEIKETLIKSDTIESAFPKKMLRFCELF